MCEFCGCSVGRSVERPVPQINVRGKTLGVRIVAVATGPTEPRAADAALGEVTHVRRSNRQHPNTSHPAEPELPGLAVRFTDEEAR